MENKSKKLAEGQAPKSLTDRQMFALPMIVAPLNSRRLRHALYHQTMEKDLNKAKEELKREDEEPKSRSPAESVGYPLTWMPLFTKLTTYEKEKASLGAVPKLKLRINPQPPPLARPKPIELGSWMARFRVLKKDQAIQTDPSIDPCVICLRAAAHRSSAIILNTERPPSIVDPVPVHSRTKDVAVEAPDRTYYGSDQLTFFRVGNFVYRGWTYRTLDGRIEHVPRFPRGIPIDQIRVEKPLRTPAPW